jgi:hypothetical protein
MIEVARSHAIVDLAVVCLRAPVGDGNPLVANKPTTVDPRQTAAVFAK